METKAAYSQPLYSQPPPATPSPLSRSLALPVLFCHLLYIYVYIYIHIHRLESSSNEKSKLQFRVKKEISLSKKSSPPSTMHLGRKRDSGVEF